MSSLGSPKVFTVSLGCPKNRVDFEKTLSLLIEQGYEITLNPEEADLLWVNTCAFIRPAVQEAIDTILELAEYKKNKEKRLIVSGCLTARYGQEKLKDLLPEVDEFLGIEPYKFLCPPKDLEPTSRLLTQNPFYGYLKITEGCSHRCSYCTIPQIRGPYRSRPKELLLLEAQNLLAKGVRELILVGQDTTLYGRDLGKKEGLLELLAELTNLPYSFRIRILYLHPQHLHEKIFTELLSLPKVVPYFDLPIQHAHPKILKAMNRHYTPERVLKLMEWARKLNPKVSFRTTVMLGFPGEEEEEFSFLLEFLKAAKFDYLGVFPFYPEEGTLAANLEPKVSYQEKRRRKREVLKLQQEITKKRLQARIGSVDEVLVLEEVSPRKLIGLATFQAPEIDGVTYIQTSLKKQSYLLPGELIKVKIEKVKIYDVLATPDV